MALTPELLEASLISTFVMMGVGLVYYGYTLWLNKKQANVQKISEEILETNKLILRELKKK